MPVCEFQNTEKKMEYLNDYITFVWKQTELKKNLFMENISDGFINPLIFAIFGLLNKKKKIFWHFFFYFKNR